MKILYNSSIILSLVLMAASLSFAVQGDSGQDRSETKVETQDNVRDQEELSKRIRLENKETLRTTGKCVDCDLAGMNLINVIRELNHNKMPIDLAGADLTEAFVSHCNLQKANLAGAKLTRTSFRNSDLTLANLTAVHVDETDFSNANLTCALLEGMSLGIESAASLDLHTTNIIGVRTSDKRSLFLLHASHSLQNWKSK